MTTSPRPPDELLRAVRADLRPVTPMASPARRVVALLWWVPAAALVVLGLLGLRADAALLGWPLTWAPVVLQAAAGFVFAGLSLAAAVPGRALARSLVLAVAALALAAQLGQALLVRQASPGKAVANPWLTHGPACCALQLALGLSVLALLAALVTRARPLRAAWSGALGGAGAGLLAASVYHLHCAVTDLRHVVLWHGGAVVLLALAGVAAGLAWERRASREMASRARSRR